MGGGAKEAKVKRGDEHKVLRWQPLPLLGGRFHMEEIVKYGGGGV